MDLNNPVVSTMITVFCSVMASSGFWAYIHKRVDKKSAQTRMILGLAHNEIVTMCHIYVKQGSISYDELKTLQHYLYEPYEELGGNGTAKLLMNAVKELSIT